jgi:hypothetical protein
VQVQAPKLPKKLSGRAPHHEALVRVEGGTPQLYNRMGPCTHLSNSGHHRAPTPPPGNFTQACHRTNLPFARRGPDIPGNLFRRSRNEKTNGRPFVRWPDRPPVPRPKRNGRSRPQRSTLQSVVVAGRAPKSSQAARQKGCRAPSRGAVNLPRPIASPQGPRRGRASQTPPLRRGRAAGCSGNQRSEGDGHPLLLCTAAPRTRRRPSPPCGAMGQGRSCPPPPT